MSALIVTLAGVRISGEVTAPLGKAVALFERDGVAAIAAVWPAWTTPAYPFDRAHFVPTKDYGRG